MRVRLSVRDGASGVEQDVLLDADPETPVAEVAAALARVAPGPQWLGAEPLVTDGNLAGRGLDDGRVVTVGPGPAGPEPRGTSPSDAAVELAVVSGPVAGRSWAATPSFTVGRDTSADIPLGDGKASKVHARFTFHPAADATGSPVWVVEDLGSTNGTWVNGRRVQGHQTLGSHDAIEIGASILELRAPVAADADVARRPDGSVVFNRPARLQPGVRSTKIQAPTRPTHADKMPFPWIQAISPLILGGVLYFVTRQVEVLAFLALSPILALSSTMTQRKRTRERTARSEEAYRSQTEEARQEAATAAREELLFERRRWADPATTAATVAAPGRRLWERRVYDPDALVLRIGVVDRRSAVELTKAAGAADALGPDDPPPLESPVLSVMPVTVDLRAAGVVGVAGPPVLTAGVGRWLVGQLCAWHSPRDLSIQVLTSPDGHPSDWSWIRWLPHARQDDPGGAPLAVGNDAASRDQRVRDLLRILDARMAVDPRGGPTQVWPPIVVVMDGVRALRSLAGVPRLLRSGPAYGIYTIGIDQDAVRLAEEGRAEVTFDPGQAVTTTVQVDGAQPIASVVADQVDEAWAEELARHLAPLRDTGGDEGGSAMIPTAVRFVDLVGMDLDSPEWVMSRWRQSGRTTAATVGVSVDGPFALDLKRDGPHALVAGTTGSGKSEFLQTLVSSLALANRPDAINFVLVDYKGASAFADCAELPHTVGLVTNLDGQGTQRALTSLEAELHRRETRLSELRLPDVDTAWENDPQSASQAGLARLVLVIDEFAELVHELPDFVTGLIRIARVGRSLGVHLILATQRPAGVVTGEMRANTGLRVALRMEGTGDSQEVLESSEAATISRSTPGRAFTRMGGGAAVVGFQSARVAGRRPGAQVGLPPVSLQPIPWARLGYPLPVVAITKETTAATDLHGIVDLIRSAANAEGFPAPRRPWLPPLPEVIGLRSVPPLDHPGGLQAPFGFEDLPAAQAQRPAFFPLEDGRHLAIVGAARSGRSTALRSLAASLAATVSPSDLHLYGLDFGNGGLLPLADLPHCGAVVLRSETDRTVRLLDRLSDELSRRQGLMASQGAGDIMEQRARSEPAERFPYIVVLIDRWEGFTGTHTLESGSTLPGQVARVLQEGAGAGILLVIAGDRTLLTDRVTSFVEDRLLLRLSNREDYRLANINPKNVAEEPLPGRAIRATTLTEVQFALLDGPAGELDGSATAQGAAARAIAAEAEARWPRQARTTLPFRVDVLPTRLTQAGVDEMVTRGITSQELVAGAAQAVIGLGGDDLSAQVVDLVTTRGLAVAGPPRSGRSTLLLQIARSLSASGTHVLAIAPRPSPLTKLETREGVELIEGMPEFADLEVAVKRALGARGPATVLLDDAATFVGTDGDEALRATLQSVGPQRLTAVVSGTVDELKTGLRGTLVEGRKAATAVIFSPTSTFDGDIINLRVPKALCGRMPAGRACLAVDGEWRLVQVPDAN